MKFYKNDFYKFSFYSLFFLPLIGTSNPAYILIMFYILIKIDKIKFKVQDLVFLSFIITWYIFKIQQSDLYASTLLLRYYFGFYLFYLFFYNLKAHVKFDKLLFFICLVVCIEAVLVNTFIKAEWLPNYPVAGEMGELRFETKIMGFYQRPYSIGVNATITSTIIMALIFYIYIFSKDVRYNKSNMVFIISILSVILLGSGTGYMLFLLFFICKTKPFKNFLSILGSILLVSIFYVLIFIFDIGSLNGLEKISSAYIQFLYDFKINQIDKVKEELFVNTSQSLIGKKFESASELVIWSDFAWNDLFCCTGYIGLGVTICIFIFKMNRNNYLPMIIFIIGALHYGAMYSLPGQLLLGYFLSLRPEKNSISWKNRLQVTNGYLMNFHKSSS